MSRSLRHLSRIAAACAVMLLLTLTTAPISYADPSPDPCVDVAVKLDTSQWVCVGTNLSYIAEDGTWIEREVPDPISSVDPESLSESTDSHTSDYDSWCETKSTCSRYWSQYIAEIKANAAFGNRDRVLGRFDVVWRQNFDGPYNRYRLSLYWDSGSAVDTDHWTALVRKEVDNWFDPTVGRAYFYNSTISSVNYISHYPSISGILYVDEPITDTNAAYHDDLYGFFYANGQSWEAGKLHLPSFACPNKKCYYPGYFN